MKISKKIAIDKFAAKHPEAAHRLYGWAKALEKISAQNLNELKQSISRVDYVPKGFTVFDVGGNLYRVVTVIDYSNQKVSVLSVFTHAEYDRWTQENRGK
jgi:mRNA interferase HigB